MRKVIFLSVALLIAGKLSAQSCTPDHWFKLADVTELEKSYFVKINASDASYFQEAIHKAQFANGSGVKLRVTTEGNTTIDLEPLGVRVPTGDQSFRFRFSPEQFASLPGSPTDLQLIVPGSHLFCGSDIVTDEVVLPVADKATTSEGTEVTITKMFSPGSEPWITNFDLGTPGENEDGKGTLAVDFDFGKKFSIAESSVVNGFWHEMNASLDFSGSFSTHKEQYFDAVQGKLGGVFRSTDLEGRRNLLRTWIVKVDAGPEATSDGDNVDYVFAARTQAIVGLKLRTRNQKFFQPFPLVGLAVETVDPDKRDDGTIPKNYTRAVASLFWHLYVSDSAALEIDGEVRRRLDNENPDERWTRRWDITLSVMTSNSWQPFLKYTRGEESPTFEFHEEVLAGIKLVDLFGIFGGR